MATPVTLPTFIPQPFALSGSKNTIPVAPDATPGHASLDLGFPPLTMTPIQSGGVPPSGMDFNGILNLITQHSVYLNAGMLYPFNASLATAIGGYPIGAVLKSNDGLSSYVSLVANNTVDFNTTPSSIGTNWAAWAGQAAQSSVQTVNVTGGTVTLTAAQYAAGVINLTGTLTSNATVVFPARIGAWRVINATTGAFTVSLRAPTGPTLPATQARVNTVFYASSALGLTFPDYDSGLHSPAFDGIPTAPTAPPQTNSKQLATTEYADLAAAAAGGNSVPQYVNATMTAGVRGDLWVDTRAAAFPVLLPAAPVGANIIQIRDITGTFDANNLTVGRNGNLINGLAEDLSLNSRGLAVGLWFDTTNNTWKVI